MMQYVQETDSKIIFYLSSAQPDPFPATVEYGTRPSALHKYFFSPPKYSSLVREAWETSSKARNQKVGKQARTLLSLIQEVIGSFELSGFDLGSLPPFKAFEAEDESVYLEWIFEHARVGFALDPNPEQSGWFLVSDRTLGNANAAGLLSGLGVERTFLWLFNFVNPKA